MKKTKLTRSLLAACSIVALSVVLSGCLHSSGDDDDMDTGGTMPTYAVLTLAEVEAGIPIEPGTYRPDAALAAAFADADESLLGVDHEMGDVVMIGGVPLTCGEGPCQVTVNTDNGTVTVVKGTIWTAGYMPPPTPPLNEEMAAEAMRIAAAIDPDSTRADADGDTADNQLPFNFDVNHGKLTTTLPATAGVVAEDDMFAESDMAIASIDEWAGSAYTRMTEDDADTEDTDEFSMDTAVAYTDRAANGSAEYSAYYADGGVPTGHAVWRGVASASGGVLTLSGTVDVGARSLIDFAHGLTAANQVLTYTDNAATTTVNEAEPSIMGMFHGVPGTYACTGTCSVGSDDDGNLSTLGGTWTFTPTAQAPGADPYMVAGVEIDDDYLTFGYWLHEENNDKGELTYSVLAFAESSVADRPTTGVVGTADYAGPATGLYMIKSFGSDGTPMPLRGGQFTAHAELTASFGGETVAARDTNSISGTISNFMDMNGDPIDSSWVVMLNRGPDTDTDDDDMDDLQNITASDGSITGVTMGMSSGGDGNAGTWAGQLHGVEDADTTETDAPTSVSGTFDAHFVNGHALGAFGARIQDE